MPSLIPVSHDPFNDPPTDLIPVDHDPFDPLAASAGVAPAGTPRIDQIDWGQPSWAQQATAQSQRDREAYARGGVSEMMRDTGATQDLAGGFGGGGIAGATKGVGGKLARAIGEYAGEHGAPDKGSGSPLHDVTANGTYPKDFYSPEGLQYYAPGHEGDIDAQSYSKIMKFKDKPDEMVKVWRAIPWEGKPPGYSLGSQNINPGDWVTISRQYAMDHGESALNGQYAIAAARVPAKELFTAGDSFHEWGWDPTPLGIRAYHGSPHDFERFDMSKIGTGEGAQAYGHGLYFAENQGTAKAYRDALAERVYKTNDGSIRYGEAFSALDDVGRALGLHPDQSGELARQVIDKLDRGAPLDDIEYPVKKFNDAYYAMVNHAQERGFTPNKGRMYEVNIAADPEHFLDWDKPLSEQHPKVQEVAEKFHTIRGGSYNPSTFSFDKPEKVIPKTGEDLWHAIHMNRGPEKGTDILREAGIPGIKYLDQGSRGVPTTNGRVQYLNGKYHIVDDFGTQAGPFDTKEMAQQYLKTPKQTSNYVVFDDKLIDIIKKYGLAGLIAGGAAHFSTQQVDHDPFATQ